MKPLLEIENVSKVFKATEPNGGSAAHKAVDDVTLALHAGETLSIVGGSGSGKTTLARIAMAMVPATSGTVRLLGEDLSTYKRLQIARVAQMIFQDPYSSLNERRTVRQNIALPLDAQGVRGAARDTRVAAMLDLVRLPAEMGQRYPRALSGGQRQRVAIARALVTEPRLLVCDEPTSALDVSIQAEIIELLRAIQHDLQTAMLFISHDLAVVASLSHRIAVMCKGRVVEMGPVADVIHRPQHPYSVELISSIPNLIRMSH